MAIGHGVASWFCCGSAYSVCPAEGSGACGTCESSKDMCAWPGASQACLDLVGTCLTHSSFVRSGCGTTIEVENYCDTSYSVTTTVADCGPYVSKFCGDTAGDCTCSVCKDRIIDLTPAAYTKLGVSLTTGLVTVRVTV